MKQSSPKQSGRGKKKQKTTTKKTPNKHHKTNENKTPKNPTKPKTIFTYKAKKQATKQNNKPTPPQKNPV